MSFAFGFLIAGALFYIGSYLNDKYMISKAYDEHRTAVCIRNQFFYIVPEEEYVALRVKLTRALPKEE